MTEACSKPSSSTPGGAQMKRTMDRRQQQSPSTRYGSLSDFYTADPLRVRSRELDVGLWWREEADGPLHRAAWVSDTGELYLVRLGPSEEGGGEVEVLGRVLDRESLERVLEGWREQCGRPRSLSWLRERALRARGRLDGREHVEGRPGRVPIHELADRSHEEPGVVPHGHVAAACEYPRLDAGYLPAQSRRVALDRQHAVELGRGEQDRAGDAVEISERHVAFST